MPIRTLSRFSPQFQTPAQTKPIFIPFGEWLPDQPALSNPGAIVVKNVIPLTDRSYGPFPSAVVYSAALTAYARGAFSARDSSGNVSNFAGDGTKLYKSSATAWTDVSKTATTYATAAKGWWEFEQFGNIVIATNLADAIQAFTLGTSSEFADLDSVAPNARTAAVIRDFLMVGNTNDGTDGDQPNRVWWPAINDPTNWPTPGSSSAAQVQSDFQNLAGTGAVQRITAAIGGADGAVFCESGIWRVSYEGPPTVFRFDQIEGARGTPAPRSVLNIGAVAFYIADDLAPYMFNGASSIPIGNQKVDKWLAANIRQDQLHRVTSVASPNDKTAMWGFMSNDSLEHPDKILIYNWAINRFAYAEVDHELLRRATADGYTLETLDSISSDIDAFPVSFDDPSLTAGATTLAIFDTEHKWSNLSGAPLAAEIETGEVNVRGMRPYIDGLRPLVDNETAVTAALKYRNSQDAGTTPTATAYTSRGTEGICFNRIEARYVRGSVKIAAGATWGHAQGVEAIQSLEGMR